MTLGKCPLKNWQKQLQRRDLAVPTLLTKAITDFDTSLGKLNPGMARQIREAFYKEDVLISVLGCYINQ